MGVGRHEESNKSFKTTFLQSEDYTSGLDDFQTGMRMPEMSGLELLKIVKEKYPQVIRLVLSGYTQITTLLTAINQGEVYKYITKPWDLEDDFIPTIREALEHYETLYGCEKVASAADSSGSGQDE